MNRDALENFSPNTRPLWADTVSINKQPQQSGQLAVDVCIVGAGITGLTAADLLKRAGKTVAVIDLARIGSGETSHTTAHLTEVFDIDYRELISNFGQEGAQLAAQSMRRSIERIEETAKRYGIECGFQRLPGYRFTEDKDMVSELEADAEAALKCGVPNTLVTDVPLPFNTARGVRFDYQAQFNPMQYLAGLAQQVRGNGCYIFEDTRMLDVEEGEPCRVTTDRGTIVADDVFVAANVPSTNKFFMHTKIAAYRTYALAAKLKNQGKLDGFDSQNLFWDMADPYHYIRSYRHNNESYLIVGGEDHKTGQDAHTSDHFKKLEDWAKQRFDIEASSHHWSGQVIEPMDGLPYIGRNPLSNHIFIATGFSGTGLTFGTLGAMLVSDIIIGNHNPWVDLYDAGRVKPWASFRSFVTENIDYPTHLIGDRVAPPQMKDTKVLRENEGAIVRMGGKKVAAYRDPQGELHLLSPVCPHLGCHVHWNDAETSWDCPCHGARFSPVGKLLNGPAVSDLSTESIESSDAASEMIPERYESPGMGSSPQITPAFSFFSCPLKPRTT